MDSGSGGVFKFDKLDENNFHIWKIRIQQLLCYRELDDFLVDDPPEDPAELLMWRKNDHKAKCLIGMSISDSYIEQIAHGDTAKTQWQLILNIFEKHTLLNKLSARRRFYTAMMKEDEKVLEFSSRVRQLANTLKSMSVNIDDAEMAMAMLNGLPERFDGLISALDAIGDDNEVFTFEYVVSRCQQEEQRHIQRISAALKKSETAALLANSSKPPCTHCGGSHRSNRCWKKFPHLRPGYSRNKALNARENDDDTIEIALFGLQLEKSLGAQNGPFVQSSKHWYIDSGCTSHMTHDRSLFITYLEVSSSPVDLGAGSWAEIKGVGDIIVALQVHGKTRQCRIKNVKHVPELRYQLLSVRSMAKLGIRTIFDLDKVYLREKGNGKLLATGSSTNNLYALDIAKDSTPEDKALMANMELWHQRLAHINNETIKNISAHGVVKGIDIKPNAGVKNCGGCILGKSHRTPFPKQSERKSKNILDLVHSDVLGPVEVPSIGGSRFIITFIDDHSNWITEYTMHKKSEALSRFIEFKAYAENQFNKKIGKIKVHQYDGSRVETDKIQKLKALRSDNGGEYLSNEFKEFLQENGIKHELTVVYSPQQNGIAERLNRTLLNLVRSMLYHHNIPKKFWAEALATAVYVRNRVTSRALPRNITPYYLWHGSKPDLSHLRVFGSKCWYVTPRAKLKKLDPRSQEAMMVGYSKQNKGYKLWNAKINRFVVSRDVKFAENLSFYPSRNETDIAEIQSTSELSNVEGSQHDHSDAIDESEHDGNGKNDSSSSENDISEPSNAGGATGPSAESNVSQLRRSARTRRPPGQWWNASETAAVSVHKFNPEIALNAVDSSVPKTYKQATSAENIDTWKAAIDKEHESLMRNRTWVLVERKPGMKVLPSKYVFKLKITGPKARVVALGLLQVHGVDYIETYAPVVNIITIRLLFALVAMLDLELDQMDVITAFLYGDIDIVIYMEVPEGLKDPKRPNLVCKLLKSLYGLKHAPRQWYAKIHSFLVELGFISSSNDPCLYTLHTSSEFMIIVLYVDDILIAGSKRASIDSIKEKFKARFEMKDMGEASEILGIEINRNRSRRTLFLHQSRYTQRVLERFEMESSKPVASPMDKSRKSKQPESFSGSDKPALDVPFRSVIGSVMYMMIGSRPDLSFAIGKLSQHLEKPLQEHWLAAKRLLRYISGTRHYGIMLGVEQNFSLVGFSDSDWAGCPESRKSTSGFVFTLAGGAISWKSKKQSVIALSTCEAEYIAASLACKEAIWLSRLHADMLNLESPKCIDLRLDNTGAIATAKNACINQRNKHIDIKYHYVRDCVGNKHINPVHWPTAEQAADLMTKALDKVKVAQLRKMLGVVPYVISLSSEGEC